MYEESRNKPALVSLGELITRMRHPERARTMITMLRRQIRDGRLRGVEVSEKITVPGATSSSGGPLQTHDMMLFDTPALWEWFTVTNEHLGAQRRAAYTRPSAEAVRAGLVDTESAAEQTREMISRIARRGTPERT